MRIVEKAKCLFWILVVEDVSDTLEQLVSLIQESIGEVGIDKAVAVDAAIKMIRQRRKEAVRYDLAILDFKLPAGQGDDPEVDETVCRELRRDRVPIIHITGFPNDPIIQAHMNTVHQRPDLAGANVSLLPKDRGWARRIVDLVRPYHRDQVSRAVAGELEAVFGHLAMGSTPVEGVCCRRRSSGRKCGTHAMIRLRAQIEHNWPYLDEATRETIRRIFPVVELDGPVKRLSLVPIREKR